MDPQYSPANNHSIPYNPIRIDTAKGEQRADWYKEINPNARLPALVHVREDGEVVKVWESAACMLYIVAAFDREGRVSYGVETGEYWQMVAWVCPFLPESEL
jgi:glutathione S-transferase